MPRIVASTAQLIDIFRAKVTVTDGCWFWTDTPNTYGYGRFHLTSKKYVMAHRWAYETFVGPIPEGMQIDHTCHNADLSCLGGVTCPHRRCVNPFHLEPKTSRENSLASSLSQASLNTAKTHCSKGHLFTEENTYRYPNGRRSCRVCMRQSTREWKQKKQNASTEGGLLCHA